MAFVIAIAITLMGGTTADSLLKQEKFEWTNLLQHFATTSCEYEVEVTWVVIKLADARDSPELVRLVDARESEGVTPEDYESLATSCRKFVATATDEPERLSIPGSVRYRMTRAGSRTIQECLRTPAINEVRDQELSALYTLPDRRLYIATNEEKIPLNTPDVMLWPLPSGDKVNAWLEGDWQQLDHRLYRKPQPTPGSRSTVRFSETVGLGRPTAFWTTSGPELPQLLVGFYGWEARADVAVPTGAIYLTQQADVLRITLFSVQRYTESVDPETVKMVIESPSEIVDRRGKLARRIESFHALPDRVRDLFELIE